MRQMFREFKRAPARIVTSILALALALGAMGVFAIPAVASSSLRASVGADRMANLGSTRPTAGSRTSHRLPSPCPAWRPCLAEVIVEVGTGRTAPGATLLPLVGRDLGRHRLDVYLGGQWPSADR